MSEQSSDAADNLQYVCELLGQLGALARTNGSPFLGYLIDVAQAEASERVAALRRNASSRAVLSEQRDPAA